MRDLIEGIFRVIGFGFGLGLVLLILSWIFWLMYRLTPWGLGF